MANERLPWWLLRALLIGRAGTIQGSNTAVDDEPPDMLDDWLLFDIGQRLDRINHLVEHPTEDVRLELEGYTETIRHRGWEAQLNAEPYDPWGVGVLAGISDTGDFLGRIAGDEPAAIRAAVDSDDLSFAFDPNVYRWTSYAGAVLPGTSGNYASTADTPPLDITGDIDLRCDLTKGTWVDGAYTPLIHKWDETTQQSFGLALTGTAGIRIIWTTGGTSATVVSADSTAAVPFATTGGRGAVRATLDVDNGAAGKTATFYTAPTIDGPWTQLGSAVTTGGTTSIFSGTAPLEIGTYDVGTTSTFEMTIHAAQVLSGIGGTTVASPNFAAQEIGTTSFSDSSGLTWFLNGTAAIDSDFPLDVRLGGEVVEVSAIATTPATFVAVGAMSSADNAAVSPALYAGGAANDWIVCVARIREASSGVITIGDTAYSRVSIDGLDANSSLQVWVKVHTGSEVAPTVTPTGGSAGDTVSAVTFGLRSMPVTWDEIDDVVLSAPCYRNSTAAQNIAYPGASVMREGAPIDGAVVIAIGGKDDDWTSVAALTGFTEMLDSSTTTGSDQGLVIDYVIQTTSAIIPDGSFTVTGGAVAVSTGVMLAFAGGYQTMTVSERSTNGVVKPHAAGTLLEVDDPLILGL